MLNRQNGHPPWIWHALIIPTITLWTSCNAKQHWERRATQNWHDHNVGTTKLSNYWEYIYIYIWWCSSSVSFFQITQVIVCTSYCTVEQGTTKRPGVKLSAPPATYPLVNYIRVQLFGNENKLHSKFAYCNKLITVLYLNWKISNHCSQFLFSYGNTQISTS